MDLTQCPPLPSSRLEAAVAGDPGAYAEVVLRVRNTLTAIALAIVRDVPTSEDIAQEALLRCWRDRAQLRAAGSLLPWLRQVTRNLARDHLRSAAVRRPHHSPPANAAAVADEAPSPDRALDAMQQRELLREAIDALPEDSRETLLLYFREGEDADAVGGLLGLSGVAVRKRISRVRQTLRSDVLARLRVVAISTAPGAGFGAALGAALIGASAPAAAAVTFGVSSAGVAAGKGTAAAALSGVAAGLVIGLLGALLGLRLRPSDSAVGYDACIRLAASWFAISAAVVMTAGVLALVGHGAPGGWTLAGLFALSLLTGAGFARLVPWLMMRRGYVPGTPSKRSMAFMWGAIVLGLCSGAIGYLLATRWVHQV